MGQTASFLGDSAAAKGAAARMFAVVDRRPAIDSAGEGGQRLAVVKGTIELRYEPVKSWPSLQFFLLMRLL